MIAPRVSAHLGDRQTSERSFIGHVWVRMHSEGLNAMARPTAAQRQTRAALDAREKSATGLAVQARSATRSTPTGAIGLSAAPSSNGRAYDPLLTVDQVSDWLGVPKGTLYQWRSRSRGPRAIKVGNGIRYRRSEIENYLDHHTDARPA